MTDWEPATEAEAALREALHADDQEQYFRILGRVELLLPISSDVIAGRVPAGWGTWTAGGRTHVLAFTSQEAMRTCLAEHAGSARKIPFYELSAAWPSLEWWLAVNPGLPIEGYLPAWFVSQLARGDARLPGRTRPERAETLDEGGAPGWATAATLPRRVGILLEGELARPPTVIPTQPAGADGAAGTDTATAEPGRAPPEPPAGPPPAAPPPPAPPAPAAPAFQPANEVEAQLLAAASTGSHDSYLSSLLLAKVLLPVGNGADPQARPGEDGFVWPTREPGEAGGGRQVEAYTSAARMADRGDPAAPAVPIRFVQLIRAWPDHSWSLAVNPGTPVGAVLPGPQIHRLATSATEVGLGDDAGVAGETGAQPATGAAPAREEERSIPMQKVIAPSQVGWYLERGYDRVAGFVHREREVAHLRTPAELVRGLGLRYEGAPFDPDAAEIYILRWSAYHPSLYRIPYGGRTEAAMAAMEGWVIERPPFRGNGFAPADTEEVIAEFKVDSVRLPHGAQLWRLRADGTAQLVAMLDADGPTWQRREGG